MIKKQNMKSASMYVTTGTKLKKVTTGLQPKQYNVASPYSELFTVTHLDR